jgi:hypothetical protein
MERINGQQPKHVALAKKVLLMVAYARRELKAIELQHALVAGHERRVICAQDLPFLETIVAVCAGLVTVDEKTNVIRLVHFTTQEYINHQFGELLPITEQYITRIRISGKSGMGAQRYQGQHLIATSALFDLWSIVRVTLMYVIPHYRHRCRLRRKAGVKPLVICCLIRGGYSWIPWMKLDLPRMVCRRQRECSYHPFIAR